MTGKSPPSVLSATGLDFTSGASHGLAGWNALLALSAIERTKKRLDPPNAWIKLELAGAGVIPDEIGVPDTKRGYFCSPSSPNATCWCLSGALMVETGDDLSLYVVTEQAILNANPEIRLAGGIPIWNDADARRKGEVLGALDNTAAFIRDWLKTAKPPAWDGREPGQAAQ